jgi:uncharacterized damage-inducible protein DinB
MSLASSASPSEMLPPWRYYLDAVPAEALDARLKAHLEAVTGFLAQLAAQPAALADFAYAPGKWTVRQVVGHLLVSQRVFVARAVFIARGETQPLPGYDENAYAENWPGSGVSLAALAAAYAVEAASTAFWTSLLSPEERTREGVANKTRVTPDQLLRALIGHESHHLDVLHARYGLDTLA